MKTYVMYLKVQRVIIKNIQGIISKWVTMKSLYTCDVCHNPDNDLETLMVNCAMRFGFEVLGRECLKC